MNNFIVDYGSPVTVSVPSGLYLYVNSVDCHGSIGCEMSNWSGGNIHTFTGSNENLKLKQMNDITFTTLDGYTNVSISYAGDQHAYRMLDSNINPNNAGRFPGAWGNGNGSKSRG